MKKTNKEEIERLNKFYSLLGKDIKYKECNKCEGIIVERSMFGQWHQEPCQKCASIEQFKDNFKHAVKDKKFLAWIRKVINEESK